YGIDTVDVLSLPMLSLPTSETLKSGGTETDCRKLEAGAVDPASALSVRTADVLWETESSISTEGGGTLLTGDRVLILSSSCERGGSLPFIVEFGEPMIVGSKGAELARPNSPA